MHLDDFDFELPRERIALRPAVPRDAARLLAVGAGLTDHRVEDLPALLAPGDLLVLNDTKVLPARLSGRRGTVAVEATLIAPLAPAQWRAFARPARRLKPGQRIDWAPGFSAEVITKEPTGAVVLDFDRAGDELMTALETFGAMPLPPYIKRPRGRDERDVRDYQTVFARRPGAIAAPTAGLHFTDALLQALAARGIGLAFVTLHVGAGTFLPVTAARPEEHNMHAEWGNVGAEAVAAIARTRHAGGRVVAVGTTALRLLETAADGAGGVRPFTGETSLFILPGFRFRVVDCLLTNFHLPRSTLFMLVAAFSGLARIRAAYAHAIAQGYRFYSYGDCCLLDPAAVTVWR
ncbi:MAG: tRNA preQ1(34) S-adenosylmethionine ribosyltransferase-isomerase QueA [Defluviicoccus sp.]